VIKIVKIWIVYYMYQSCPYHNCYMVNMTLTQNQNMHATKLQKRTVHLNAVIHLENCSKILT